MCASARISSALEIAETGVDRLRWQWLNQLRRGARQDLLLEIVGKRNELRFLEIAAIRPDAGGLSCLVRPTGIEMLG